MLKRANGRPVPNNPAKAYELGRLDGTKQCMDNVSCVLLDKCVFHVREETADKHDTRILEYLQLMPCKIKWRGNPRARHPQPGIFTAVSCGACGGQKQRIYQDDGHRKGPSGRI